MHKIILFSDKARNKIKKGVDILVKAVEQTLGPKGKCAIFHHARPTFTLDGVTVAKQVVLEDRIENIGCKLIQQIAEKTDREAGDGTTTATILAGVILNEGLKGIAAGIDRTEMKRGLSDGQKIVVKMLSEISTPIDGKKQISDLATISSREREIGDVIAGIIEEAGNEAVIAVEEMKTIGIQQEVVKGMELDSGFISPYMMTNPERGEVLLEKPYILTTGQVLNSNPELIALLEGLARRADTKSLLIIADDVKGEALSTIVINKLKGILNIAAIKAPEFGEEKIAILQDTAIITGGQLFAEETAKRVSEIDAENFKDELGRAERVIITQDKTIIIGGKGDKKEINKRIKELKTAQEKTDSDFKRGQLEKRIAKLSGGIAVIKVGCYSEEESKEKRFRIEDAVRAAHSAIAEGIIPGAGMAYIRCSQKLEELIAQQTDISYRMGLEIINKAIQTPAHAIIENSGKKADIIIERCKENKNPNYGYNSATDEYGDLIKMGVLDPVRVARVALENAVSVISLLLITETVMVDDPAAEPK